MSTGIKPIETRYAGCRFRSRLEARWAVFFDRLGIRWEYEPQGYALDSGAYLPDFWLPEVESTSEKSGVWFEVKPDAPGEVSEIDVDPRWEDLARETGCSLVVTRGMPRPGDDLVWDSVFVHGHMQELFPTDFGDGPEVGWDNGRAFNICHTCASVGIKFEGRLERFRCGHSNDRSDNWHPRILAAYTAALSARFEHGERG